MKIYSVSHTYRYRASDLLLGGVRAIATLAMVFASLASVTAQTTITNVITAAIDVPGERDVYTFNVNADSRFYFDSLTNTSAVQWSLQGPPGTLVANRSFANSDAQNVTDPTVSLPVGDYSLTVQAPNAVTSGYAFRLVNLTEATLLVPGTVVTNNLVPANKTDFYQFQALAGDQFYFQRVARVSLPNTYWRLLNRYGNQVFSRDFNDVGTPEAPVTLPTSGNYTLLIEGNINDAGSGSYAFNVVPEGHVDLPEFMGTAMSLGERITGDIVANSTNSYIFTLASFARVVFDTQTNSLNATWSLQGPSGLVVSPRNLNSSDGVYNYPPLSLPAGDYQLLVRASANSPYAFRLLDLASAVSVDPGEEVAGDLSPASAIVPYQFEVGSAGEYFFNYRSTTGLNNTYWRLIDPYNNVIFHSPLVNDQGPVRLANPGSYRLLIDGYHNDTGSGSYTFELLTVADGLEALTLGNVVNGAVSSPGQQRRYTFTLASPTRLYFDSHTNTSQLRWSLDGPDGNVVNNTSFSSDRNLGEISSGDFTLTVFGSGDTTNNYAFRLFDLATAVPLTPGVSVNDTLNSATAAKAYRFSLATEGKYFFDFLSSSGLPNASWQLLDPRGASVFSAGLGSDMGPYRLSAGTYTLLVTGYNNDPGTGSYTFNVAPVIDGLESLMLGDVVSGAVSSPGQRRQYTFALATSTWLYFDSHTNLSQLRWSLDGPLGNLVNNVGANADRNLGTLIAGDYTLTIYANGDVVSDYQFRLFDPETEATLTPGTPVNDTLNPATSAKAYRFTVDSEANYFFDFLSSSGVPNASWQLLDPQGKSVFNVGLGSDTGPYRLLVGDYTLLVIGYNYDIGSGNYSFNVMPVTDGLQALTLGDGVTGVVSTPGQRRRYTFALASPAWLYFDSQTNVSQLRWALDGPTGNVVNNIGFSADRNLGRLPTGDYTLTVWGNGDDLGDFRFRLFDLGSAGLLPPGSAVTDTLDPATSAQAYRIDLSAAGKYFFDFQSSSGVPNARWHLLDPRGESVFNVGLATDAGPYILPAGIYTLLVVGYNSETGNGTYTIEVIPVTDGLQALTINGLVTGAVGSSGQAQQHLFTLGAPARLYFDALTDDNQLRWTLTGPTGNEVNNRAFTASDAQSVGTPVIVAPAGSYTLTVFASGDHTGAYQFRLFDLATATSLTPGTPVGAPLSPANATAAYQFGAAAGDRFFFDHQSVDGLSSAHWRLIDPYNKILFSRSFSSDAGTYTLAAAGTYLVLIEGHVSNQGSGSYGFNVQAEGNIPPAPLTGTPLTQDTLIDGSLATSDSTNNYTFSLPTAARLYFDALTYANYQWSLLGPGGLIVDRRSFQNSDATESTDPSLALPIGDYQLNVTGPAGDYAFRLLDFANATEFTPGTVVNGALAPGNSTMIHWFSGNAGDSYYFDGQPTSGFTYQPYTRIYGPLGNILQSVNVNNDVDTFVLPQTGSYAVTVEGRIYDAKPSGNYSFELVPQNYPTNALELGNTINGTIPVVGQRHVYTVTLPADATLYFDSLTNANFSWRLDTISGQVLNWRTFSSSDSQELSNPALPLAAGSYTLTVAGNGFTTTGDYAFRLLDFANAIDFAPGTVVTDSLAPGNSTVLYRFSGNAGDRYYFDGQPTSGFTYQPYTRIYGPLGNIIQAVSTRNDVDTFTLPQTGSYVLTVEGRIYDLNASGDYAFNLVPQSYPTNTLELGNTVNGTIPLVGQRNFYPLELAVATTLYFDSLTNAEFSWRLDAPWGEVVNWRMFSSSDSQELSNPALPLAAGSYTLTVAGNGFTTTGDYAFRLLEFANAIDFAPGTVVSDSLAPGNSTVLYRFSGNAGDRYYFDGQPTSGFTYQPYTRIYGPLGNIIQAVSTRNDVDTFTLPQTGSYVLTVEGRIYDLNVSGDFAFNLVPQEYPTSALEVGTLISGTIPVIGQRNLYTLNLAEPATLYFDALSNAEISWRLDAPWGQVVNWRGFTGSDAAHISNPALSLPAGSYTLTVAGNGFIVTGDYAFRLLDFTSAVEFTPGTAVSGSLTPGNSTVWYQFEATAGDRYYFDGQPTSGFTHHPYTRIYGPEGHIDRTTSVNDDLDTFTVAKTGAYVVTVEGNIYDQSASGNFAFNLVPNPVVPPQPIFETDVTADLVVSSVAVSPTSGLLSGGSATVLWTVRNTGNGATSGSFIDRVTIRNGGGGVLVDAFLPYNEGDAGNGSIVGGGFRNRQLAVTLPDGPDSVGTLQVTVTTDAQNGIAESSEANNSTSNTINVALAPYPDLQVIAISATPPTGWLPGSVVTIQWKSTNSGTSVATGSWVDSVVVRNTNSAQTIFSGTKNYNLNDAGNGPIAVGDSRDRSLAFTLPTDARAYGGFAITVTADSASQLFEHNAGGTAELNNATTATIISAPDIVPGGLTVSPPSGSIRSGSTITVSWNDANNGTVETGGGFSDRVTVINTDTAETLLNTTVYYNPATTDNGAIPPGGQRARSTALTLPNGPRGVGSLQVTVSADTFSQLPEVNSGGTAELNNTVSTAVVSSIADYPDFQVINLTIEPGTLASGTNVTIRWEDANTGNATVAQNWYDRIAIVNTNSGTTLLDTVLLYNQNTLGPLTNGTSRSRAHSFTLPDGPAAVGNLRFTITADTYDGVFEYNPDGTGESNNQASVVVGSSIAPYPDLEVINLQVEPGSLASGTNVTVRWQDANTGTAPTVGSWYDRLSVVNTNIGVTLLETAVYYDADDLGALTNGAARDRSHSFALPYTTNGTGNLRFTVTADAFDYLFEFNSGGTGENNNSNSVVRFSSLTPLPDLIVTGVTTPPTALTDQAFTVHFDVENQGVLAAEGNISQRVFVSSAPTVGSGVLVAVTAFNGPLEAGARTNQTVTLQTPSTPGTYWLIVRTDGSENVQELSESNNTTVSATPFTVQPAYTASLVVDERLALANTPIPMHGLATRGDSGLPAAFSAVKIHVLVRGTDRTYDVLTAADGTFTNVFYPLPNEAGNYQVAAAFPNVARPPVQDSFTLIGMSVNRVPLVNIIEATSITNTTSVNNLSDVPLTGLSVAVVTNQANLSVTASLETDTITGFGKANLRLAITALDSSVYQSPVVLEVTSAEGATARLIVTVRVEALRPKLVTSPTALNGAVVRGSQTPFAFTLSNRGGVPTGPLEVALPSEPWFSLASSNLLPPLPAGSNTVVTVLVNPAADLPLGDYRGSLVVQSTNAGLSVPYSFRAISAAKGDMLVSVEDEYTYFVEGSPRVTNAMVVLSDALSRAPVTTNYTGVDGSILFTNLTEAFYIVDVTATNHSPFRQTALVSSGTTTNVVAFLTRQTVRYSFTVVPTTVEDSYIFTVDSTFETQVPVPVVTITPSSIDLSQYPGTEFQVLLTVRNHGLIDAESVKLNIPSTPVLQFTPLVTDLGKLKANTSLTVPMIVKRTPPATPLATSSLEPLDYLSGQCSVTGEMLWNYLCGPNVVDKSTAFYAFDSTGCDLVDLYRQVYHLVPDAGTPAAGPVIGSDDFFDYLDSLNPVTDFEAPPGYHFECNASPGGDPFTLNAVRSRSAGMALQGDSKGLFGDNDVCAKVQLRLDQKAVLTRDAFKATLEIDNDLPGSLQNLQVDLTIVGSGGSSVETNFSITAGELSGFTALDGTGILAGNTLGTANWTLIPTLEAAPTNGVALYLVGGTLSYTQDGVDLTIPLGPAPIQVYPQPELMVRYFHDRDVYADDPFTPEVEPSRPYSLAAQINNVGYGPARSLTITSGKPQIIENLKGLLIDFTILGAQLESQAVTPALDVNFGQIPSGTNKTARWLFSSPIQGSFTNFSASFKQVSPFGDQRLSLVRSVEIHELIHIVDGNGPLADGRVDYLVNDSPDPDFLPDAIYLSDGSTNLVNAVTNAVINGVLGGGNLQVVAGAAAPAGWSYFRFGDPGQGQYKLLKVLRSDDSEVPLGTNVWTTDRSFLGGDERPILTNLVHLVDYDSAGSYTLLYEEVPVVNDTDAPSSQVTALPLSSPPIFTVQWSGADNPGGSGVWAYDIEVSINGGAFQPWITNTPLTAAIYSGAVNKDYAFRSQAVDLAGNREPPHAVADTQTTTSAPANAAPVLDSIPPQSVSGGSLFTLLPSATDPDVPAQTLTWSLLPGAPPSALISPSNGRITWQTQPTDDGTITFTVVVTDNGSPQLSASETFTVQVVRTNHPPVITLPGPQITVDEETPLSLQLTAVDPDVTDALTWTWAAEVPSGLNFDAASGLLTWTPTETQGPGSYVATVVVTDDGTPNLSATNTFTLLVNEVNRPPVLSSMPAQTGLVLSPLVLSYSATDPDIPANSLSYSLGSGAPRATSIDATTGEFSWVPARDRAGTTNHINVVVTDNGVPPLTHTNTLTVVVGHYLEATWGDAVVEAGQAASVSLTLDASTPISNVDFVLDISQSGLTDFTLADLVPALGLGTLTPITPERQFRISLQTLGGEVLSGNQAVLNLNFSAEANASSAFVRLKISSLSAEQPDGSAMPRALSNEGVVTLVNVEPLLVARLTGGVTREITVFGKPGSSYQLQYASDLSGQNPLQNWMRVPMTGLSKTIEPINPGTPNVFFRAYEFVANPPIIDTDLAADRKLSLTLYGRPNVSYQLQHRGDLSSSSDWDLWEAYTPTNSFYFIDDLSPTNSIIFFHIVEP